MKLKIKPIQIFFLVLSLIVLGTTFYLSYDATKSQEKSAKVRVKIQTQSPNSLPHDSSSNNPDKDHLQNTENQKRREAAVRATTGSSESQPRTAIGQELTPPTNTDTSMNESQDEPYRDSAEPSEGAEEQEVANQNSQPPEQPRNPPQPSETIAPPVAEQPVPTKEEIEEQETVPANTDEYYKYVVTKKPELLKDPNLGKEMIDKFMKDRDYEHAAETYNQLLLNGTIPPGGKTACLKEKIEALNPDAKKRNLMQLFCH